MGTYGTKLANYAANIGQLPVYYNKKPPMPHDYVEMSARPLYAFGYGLSYTTFEYHSLEVVKVSDTQFQVSFHVTNTGNYDGDEVVQLYLHDEIASTAQPIMQLKKFKRVFIPKGENSTVVFNLDADDFSIIDANLQRVVEPGDFTVMIGPSSDNIVLKTKITID